MFHCFCICVCASVEASVFSSIPEVISCTGEDFTKVTGLKWMNLSCCKELVTELKSVLLILTVQEISLMSVRERLSMHFADLWEDSCTGKLGHLQDSPSFPCSFHLLHHHLGREAEQIIELDLRSALDCTWHAGWLLASHYPWVQIFTCYEQGVTPLLCNIFWSLWSQELKLDMRCCGYSPLFILNRKAGKVKKKSVVWNKWSLNLFLYPLPLQFPENFYFQTCSQ